MVTKRLLLIASFADSLVLFRGDLITACIAAGCEVHTAAPDVSEEMHERLTGMGAKVHEIPLQRTGMNPLKDLQLVFSLRRLMAKIAPDAVMTYTIKPCIYGQIAARLAGVPWRLALITGLGFAFTGEKTGKGKVLQKILQGLYAHALTSAHKVVFQNPDDRDLFVEKKLVARDKTELVNGSGVNLSQFDVAALPPTDKIHFLFIGRLLKDKGLYEFVEAANRIRQAFAHAEFHVVGWFDNNPTAITREEVDHWLSSELIHFHGKLDDVRPMIAASHVFVLPSYREGTPRTVLEAMAMGRPVITTDAPGCRETVKHSENGYLVPVGDAQALAEKMQMFIESPDLVTTKGQAARQLAEQLFDVKVVNKQMMKYLQIQSN